MYNRVDTSAIFDRVSLEQLELLASNLSMEALNVPGQSMDVRKRFSQFFSSASAFFSKLSIGNLVALRPLGNDLDGIIARYGFVDAANKNVIVPEGFIGQWVPYSQALKDAMGSASKLDYLVRSLNETIGRVLHDPDLLTGASGIGHTGPVTAGVSVAVQDIGKRFFDGNNVQIRRTLGAVIERSQDVKITKQNLTDAIALDKANPSSKVQESINRTMELAGKLLPLVEDRAAVAKRGSQELVEITLNIAREVESYGVLLFRVRQFNESLKDSITELKK